MSREVVMSIRRSPLGTCSLCLKPAETVVGCSARIDSPFYGFCLSCVERMARVARVAQPKRTPSKKKGT